MSHVEVIMYRCCMLSFGSSPGVWILCADVSERSINSIFIGGVLAYNTYENGHRVPKRGHINFRRRGMTQKNEYDIQKTEEVWTQELYKVLH
jgi:hypothetical protein